MDDAVVLGFHSHHPTHPYVCRCAAGCNGQPGNNLTVVTLAAANKTALLNYNITVPGPESAAPEASGQIYGRIYVQV